MLCNTAIPVTSSRIGFWALADSMSNGSFWHVIPMFSWGSRYVDTSPVWRFSSKFDVLKNSLSAGLLNSILPSVVSSWSLFSIRSPTLVLQRSGTYQSRLMVPCCHTNSLMASSLVLCSSIAGFMTWSIAFCSCSGFASLSTSCAIALVWTPMLFSVDIPYWHVLVCSLLFVGCVWFSVSGPELSSLLSRTVLSCSLATTVLSHSLWTTVLFCKKFIF